MESFRNPAYVSFKTFRRSGVGVATPVWFALGDGDKGYIFSAGNAGKIKRLRNSNLAELAVCDVRGKVSGEWVPVKATVIDDSAEIDVALAALRNKYGWQMKLADIGSKLTGKFNKRAYIRVYLDPS